MSAACSPSAARTPTPMTVPKRADLPWSFVSFCFHESSDHDRQEGGGSGGGGLNEGRWEVVEAAEPCHGSQKRGQLIGEREGQARGEMQD